EALCLLTAHRDQSGYVRGWFPGSEAGLVRPSRHLPGLSAQWHSSGFSSATVAGAAPASNRLPNYPAVVSADGHLERTHNTMPLAGVIPGKRHAPDEKATGYYQSHASAPPFWYSMTRVSKKFFSFLRSIASLIHGNGFSVSAKTGGRPSWAQRRLAMQCMYCSHSAALRPREPRGVVSRP